MEVQPSAFRGVNGFEKLYISVFPCFSCALLQRQHMLAYAAVERHHVVPETVTGRIKTITRSHHFQIRATILVF